MDTSVSVTIHKLVCLAAKVSNKIRRACLEQANRFQRKFKVTEKRFYHLKVKAMAETQQWKHLHELSLERKPPIGFKPFATACLRAGNPLEAERYIAQIPQFEERYDTWRQFEHWQQAANVASEMQDLDKLQQLRIFCPDAALRDQIDQMQQQVPVPPSSSPLPLFFKSRRREAPQEVPPSSPLSSSSSSPPLASSEVQHPWLHGL